MKLAPSIKKETGHIAAGVLIGDAVMLAVFALLQKLDYTVPLGALLGSTAAVLNFLFMAISCQKAMDNPDSAKKIVQKSYGTRMLVMVAVMAIGIALPIFHSVAVVVPFLLPNLTIKVMQLLGLVNLDRNGGEKS